ncbi:hypothetical protein [Oceanotoga phage vB_OteS-UFV02]
MMIRYKTIEHNVIGDAPFIGARISSINCPFNCPGCFNQHLKKIPTKKLSGEQIIKLVKFNIFNQGLILAGLEWTDQPLEMYALIEEALHEGLEVILYTHHSEEEFKNKFRLYPIYIKFGAYDQENKNIGNKKSLGVTLASNNQYIKDFREEKFL